MSYVIDARQATEILNEKSGTFLIFLIIFVIIMFFITVVLAFDAVFFADITSGNCPAISIEESNVLFWINVVFAIISGIAVFVGIFMVFYVRSKPKWIVMQTIPQYQVSDPFLAKQAQLTHLKQQVNVLEAQLRGQAATEAARLQELALE